ILDTFGSRAFAVCDHQLAHVYVKNPDDVPRVRDVVLSEPVVARALVGDERAEIGLDHRRSGEIVALSQPDAWFAYPFWLDDAGEPDFARTIDIHRKPGYDPCELFFDPSLAWPKGRAARRLIQKKLGFRTLFDVVPIDTSLVKGSHGLPPDLDTDRPALRPGTDVAVAAGSAAPAAEDIGLPDAIRRRTGRRIARQRQPWTARRPRYRPTIADW